MIVFYTSSAAHFGGQLPFEIGSYILKQFSDGEYYIKLEHDVANKTVWVVTATNPPAEHLLELFLLLNALARADARINLLFTYFGYARQDRPIEGEASSAEVISTIFKTFFIKKIFIIHAHSPLLHNYLAFKNIIPVDLICQATQSYDAIAAPDKGAYELVKYLSDRCKIEPIFLTKIRPEQEIVKILEYDGVVRAKRILIVDDIIATGNTIIEVSKTLLKLGAQHISVWATHGIFAGNALALIQESVISKVYVTNSVTKEVTSGKIEVISIAPLLETIITENSLT